jgi:hypothetical protein
MVKKVAKKKASTKKEKECPCKPCVCEEDCACVADDCKCPKVTKKEKKAPKPKVTKAKKAAPKRRTASKKKSAPKRKAARKTAKKK